MNLMGTCSPIVLNVDLLYLLSVFLLSSVLLYGAVGEGGFGGMANEELNGGETGYPRSISGC
jgi:hypothetical protein